MDQNEKNDFTPLDYVTLTFFGGVFAFSAYHLGKLGVDYAREIVRIVKEKKNQK